MIYIMDDMEDGMAGISDDLRGTLAQVYALGFLDYCAGTPVEDDDTIPAEVALLLHDLATKYIEASEALIAALYPENPQAVHQSLYVVGYQAAKAIEELGPRPVYLN